jgi:hypothetical protein
VEESAKLTQPTPSGQISTVPANVPELHEQARKKDYQQPKLESLGTIRTVTAVS